MKKLFSTQFLFLIAISTFAQGWQSQANVPVQLAFPVVVSLNGNIHVLGGGGPLGATDLHLRYKPSTDTWDTLPPVPYLAQQPAGAVVNGKIHYCGGGYPNTGTRLAKHYYYNPDSTMWYQAADMPVATAIHEAAELDGKLFCLSGQPNKNLCQYFNPDSNTWVNLNPLPDANFWYGAIVSTGTSIYRFGGGGYTAPTAKAHKYNKASDTWTALPDMPQARHGLSGDILNDSTICLAGGYISGYSKNVVWLFNMNTLAYTTIDTLPVGREYHGMAVAGNCLFSVGGNNALDTSIGTSLIKNCNLNIAPITNEIVEENTNSYSLISTLSRFELSWNDDSRENEGAYKIIDINGRILFEKKINAGENGIYLKGENFASGLYIISCVIGNQSIVKRWIVQH